MGAPWPSADPVKTATPRENTFQVTEKDREFWSFQPVRQPPLPAVKNVDWARSPIDRFILAKLEEKQLTPSSPAQRRVLLRRVTFDLTGLPPTPEEIDAFLADKSTEAFARVVDRLLCERRSLVRAALAVELLDLDLAVGVGGVELVDGQLDALLDVHAEVRVVAGGRAHAPTRAR
jgi:hypothetical protein